MARVTPKEKLEQLANFAVYYEANRGVVGALVESRGKDGVLKKLKSKDIKDSSLFGVNRPAAPVKRKRKQFVSLKK